MWDHPKFVTFHEIIRETAAAQTSAAVFFKTINLMDKIKIYFDGSCLPINPGGKMGIGVKITMIHDGIETVEFLAGEFEPHPQNTNSVAEYLALKKGLEFIIESGNTDCPDIEVLGDSQFVIRQMQGVYRIRKGEYLPIAQKCVEIKTQIPSIRFTWIERSKNNDADKLSRGIIPGNPPSCVPQWLLDT